MATVGQVYYNVMDGNSGGYTSSKGIDIFSNFVPVFGNAFTKLGILAPPGTKVVMNDNKVIMVGRTGIYELDDEIEIKSLWFQKPLKYVKDEEASASAKAQGIQGMIDANAARQAALNALNVAYPSIPTDESNPNYAPYWSRYNEIQRVYIEQYQEALSLFNTGSNGIYVQPNPANPDDPANFEDLYNVIVDFIFT